jgi:BirA family biotin operon repressor/biotin-[acetyl-CoA-carboxylase] ligase
MSKSEVEKWMTGLPVAAWLYYDCIGSTNEVAAEWAAHGAPDWAVVIANEQTAGRGRAGRRWITPRGSALAFSVVLHPAAHLPLAHYAAMGAIAVCQALEEMFSLPCRVKWPNDVLLNHKKTAGVLVETTWSGDSVVASILGIGVNISPRSIPDAALLAFPATCVENELGQSIERWELLARIIERLADWHASLGSPRILQTWNDYLAWKGQEVYLLTEDGQPQISGILDGLEPDGALRLVTSSGSCEMIHAGDLHLRSLK